MPKAIKIGLNGNRIGHGEPCYIIAECGINHNGDIQIAEKLSQAAVKAGVDAVKFQLRDPDICVPEEQKNVPRETPWGTMSYIEYRKRLELDYGGLKRIGCDCFPSDFILSVFDEHSIDVAVSASAKAIKIPSAMLTNTELLEAARATELPIILSTGMSTMAEIYGAVRTLGTSDLLIMHCTSSYPCVPDELNLLMIETLRSEFDCPVGYSGHEVGLQTTLAAVAMGACAVERHITLDRSMWGTDQAASVEPDGLRRLVRDIRIIERAFGDGVKRVYDSELPSIRKLRGCKSSSEG